MNQVAYSALVADPDLVWLLPPGSEITAATAAQAVALDAPDLGVTVSIQDTADGYAASLDAVEQIALSGAVASVSETPQSVTSVRRLPGGYAIQTTTFQDSPLVVTPSQLVADVDAVALWPDRVSVTGPVSAPSAWIASHLTQLAKVEQTAYFAVSSTDGPVAMTEAAYLTGPVAAAYLTAQIAVTGATAAQAGQIVADARVVSVAVVDTSADVSLALDSLEGVIKHGVSVSVALSDGGPLVVTRAELLDDGDAIASVAGQHPVELVGVTTAHAAVPRIFG